MGYFTIFIFSLMFGVSSAGMCAFLHHDYTENCPIFEMKGKISARNLTSSLKRTFRDTIIHYCDYFKEIKPFADRYTQRKPLILDTISTEGQAKEVTEDAWAYDTMKPICEESAQYHFSEARGRGLYYYSLQPSDAIEMEMIVDLPLNKTNVRRFFNVTIHPDDTVCDFFASIRKAVHGHVLFRNDMSVEFRCIAVSNKCRQRKISIEKKDCYEGERGIYERIIREFPGARECFPLVRGAYAATNNGIVVWMDPNFHSIL